MGAVERAMNITAEEKARTAALAPLVERVDRSHCNVDGFAVSELLTDHHIHRHVLGLAKVGAYQVSPGENTVRSGLIDIDSHKGEVPWNLMTEAAARLTSALGRGGLTPIPFRSSGGRGIHLYFVWDEPQDARSVRIYLRNLIALEGFKDRAGAGGVANNNVEIFPKQDAVERGRWGNMSVLPLGGATASVALNPETFEPIAPDDVVWVLSSPVPIEPPESTKPRDPKEPREPCAPVNAEVDLRDVEAACAAIPDERLSQMTYDQFRDLTYAIHHATGGSEVGLDIAEAMWSRSDRHDGGQTLREKVWKYAKINRETGATITVATLYAEADRVAPGWRRARAIDDFADETEAATEIPDTPAAEKGRVSSQDPIDELPDGGRIDTTDAGNANALVKIAKGNLRYIVERKTWMSWRRGQWNIDVNGTMAFRTARRVAEYWRFEADRLEKKAEQLAKSDEADKLKRIAKSLRDWAKTSRSSRAISAMLTLACHDERMIVSVEQLDRNPFILGVANGVVDLRTGELRPAGRDDLVTKRSPYPYDSNARAPRFDQFISEITGLQLPERPGIAYDPVTSWQPRPALASFVHRWAGYATTGITREHKMLIATGAGSNGKSALLDVIGKVLGPYYYPLPVEALLASSRDTDAERPTPFARNLAGARLAVGSEPKEGQALASGWIKRQTGDARISARGLHENVFTFDVTHKLVLLANRTPPLDHLDAATRGRVHVVPFDRVWNRPGVVERDPTKPDGDKRLMDTLLDEAEGILAWLVRGATLYFREGLEPPVEVVSKTSAYFHDQDGFARWLSECERCASHVGTRASDLFESFCSWCAAEEVQDHRTRNSMTFSLALQEAGLIPLKTRSGRLYGLRGPAGIEFDGAEA